MTMTYIKFIDNKLYMHILHEHIEKMQLLLTMHLKTTYTVIADMCSKLYV